MAPPGGTLKPGRVSRLLGFAALVLLAGIIAALIGRAFDPSWRWGGRAPIHHGYGPADHPAAVKLADNDVLLGEERVRRAPDEWVFQEYLAQALLTRARLTGSFADLKRAEAAIASGLASAPDRTGPFLVAALGNMTLHRLPPVAGLLDKLGEAVVPADVAERADAAAIRGDLALYSGHYAAARDAYAMAARLHNDAGIALRLANWHRTQGHFDEAMAQIDAALAMVRAPTRQFHANLLLQQGSFLLDHGDWPAAEASFAAADELFPGYWRTEAFRAQMAAVRGDTAAAIAGYRTILARADPPPEVFDALAAVYRSTGDTVASNAAAARAATIWQQRLALLPEAAVGHALEHELVFGTPTRALALARQNVAARPYGDALVLLGWAQLQAGDPAAAARTIAGVEASGWRTPQQYLVLADAEALLGRPDAAEAARARALALNPRATDPATPLLWFGNH